MPDRFTYVKRGYDPEEVDAYVNSLEEVIKSYKDKDNSIKNAIISAQMAADNIVRNANIQAEETRRAVAAQMYGITQSVSEQRVRVKEFQDEYTSFVKRYLGDINEYDLTRIHNKINDLEAYIKRIYYPNPGAGNAPGAAETVQNPTGKSIQGNPAGNAPNNPNAANAGQNNVSNIVAGIVSSAVPRDFTGTMPGNFTGGQNPPEPKANP